MKSIITVLIILTLTANNFAAQENQNNEQANTPGQVNTAEQPEATQQQPDTQNTPGNQQAGINTTEQKSKINVKMFGTIDTYFYYYNMQNETNSSRVDLFANIRFTLDYMNWVKAYVGFEVDTFIAYDDFKDVMDILYIELGDKNKFPLLFKLGKFYNPFQLLYGIFYTTPMTNKFGEIKIPSAELYFSISWFTVGVGIFRSYSQINRDNAGAAIRDGYAYIRFEPKILKGLKIQTAVISNLLDSLFFDGSYGGYLSGGATQITHRVPGLSAGISLSFWKITLSGEFMTTLKKCDWLDNAKPYTWFGEIDFQPSKRFKIGLRFEDAYKMSWDMTAGGIVYVYFGNFKIALEVLYVVNNDAEKSKGFSVTALTSLSF